MFIFIRRFDLLLMIYIYIVKWVLIKVVQKSIDFSELKKKRAECTIKNHISGEHFILIQQICEIIIIRWLSAVCVHIYFVLRTPDSI